MTMNKGDVIIIRLTGKEMLNGKVFETTEEKIAKEAGIYAENARYEPTPVVVGKGELIKGLDEQLTGMNVGEEKAIIIEPKNAFGERNPELVRVVPLAEFHKRKVQPFAGLIVDVNGYRGKVQSVSGGRVRVDFNPELAGRNIEYKVKIEKKLDGAEEKLDVLTRKYLPLGKDKLKTGIKDGIAEIQLPGNLPQEVNQLKQLLNVLLKEAIPEIKSIKFVETFDVKLEGKAGKEAEVGKTSDVKLDDKKIKEASGKKAVGKKPEGKKKKAAKK